MEIKTVEERLELQRGEGCRGQRCLTAGGDEEGRGVNRWMKNSVRISSNHLEEESVLAFISRLKENTIDHFKSQRTPCVFALIRIHRFETQTNRQPE